jgi:hypothetical protein
VTDTTAFPIDDEDEELRDTRRPRWLRRLVALVAAAAILGGAVGGAIVRVLDDGTGLVEPSGSGEADLQRFVDIIREAGTPGGGPPPTSPSALAQRVDLVVVGTIAGFRPGRVGEDDPFRAVPLVTMDVRVERVVKGALPGDGDGVVHVELGIFGIEDGTTPETLGAVAPSGRVALYLTGPAPGNREGSLPRFTDPGAGRPEGQPLWWVWSELGFFTELPDGTIFDLSGRATPGEHRGADADLEAILPPADRWPG